MISTLFLFPHHSFIFRVSVTEAFLELFFLPLRAPSPSSSPSLRSLSPHSPSPDSGFGFRCTWNINICSTRSHAHAQRQGRILHRHPSSTRHPLSRRVSPTLSEQDKGLFYAASLGLRRPRQQQRNLGKLTVVSTMSPYKELQFISTLSFSPQLFFFSPPFP